MMHDYALGLYEKALPSALSWREKLDFAGEAGYDYVEVSIDESDGRLSRLDWDGPALAEVEAAVRESGVPLRSMCLSAHRKYPLGSPDPAVRARSLEIMEKALRLAAALGIRTIQLAGYDVYYEPGSAETRALFAENLRRTADMAAREGVLLGFETMETPFMDTVGKAMRYVKLVDSPYLGVYPDAGNLNNAALSSGGSVAEDLALGRGRLVALHLKPTRPGQYRDLYFDDSAQRVDFPAVISAAWSLGVRRYVTELWHLDRPDWKNNIRYACASMRALLDREERKHEG